MNEISPRGTLQDTHYSMEKPTPKVLSVGFDSDGIMELGEDFDISEFQVVRREFFAHIREPSITFNNCKFSVNTACLNKFPNYDYAQILINRKKRILIIRPCYESDKDSFENLETEEVIHEAEDKVCPECGSEMEVIGKEFIRDELVYVPARMFVRKHYVETTRCVSCGIDESRDNENLST